MRRAGDRARPPLNSAAAPARSPSLLLTAVHASHAPPHKLLLGHDHSAQHITPSLVSKSPLAGRNNNHSFAVPRNPHRPAITNYPQQNQPGQASPDNHTSTHSQTCCTRPQVKSAALLSGQQLRSHIRSGKRYGAALSQLRSARPSSPAACPCRHCSPLRTQTCRRPAP